MSDALRRAAEVIADSDELALACHIGPDGDALGSMLGLAIAAANEGKKVTASFGAPFEVPGNLSFLPTDLLVAPSEFPAEPTTMVVLDAGSPDRLGELAVNATKAKTLVVLDHHITNEGFGDVAVIDGSAAATGEIVFHLLGLLGWHIDESIAGCLHTALVTDTGRFTYANTSPETLRAGAELLEAGASPTEIGRHVYEESPFGYLKVLGTALTRVRLNEEASVVATFVTQGDLDEAGVDWGDIDGVMDTIRLAQEADMAVVAKVHDGHRVKVSLRSRGGTDVGALAAVMGGGGHRLAAGYTVEGEADEVIDSILSVVEDFR